jgi:hypothetical protein
MASIYRIINNYELIRKQDIMTHFKVLSEHWNMANASGQTVSENTFEVTLPFAFIRPCATSVTVHSSFFLTDTTCFGLIGHLQMYSLLWLRDLLVPVKLVCYSYAVSAHYFWLPGLTICWAACVCLMVLFGLWGATTQKTRAPARTLKTATANKWNKTIRQTRSAQGHQNWNRWLTHKTRSNLRQPQKRSKTALHLAADPLITTTCTPDDGRNMCL